MKTSRFPEILYRAFRERQYAQDFVENGTFRLGLLEMYRSIEDQSRQDCREGKSSSYINTNVEEVTIDRRTMTAIDSVSVPGCLHLGGTFIGPIYVMCTSNPKIDLDYLRNRFGNWIVRINKPSRLLDDLRKAVPTNTNVTITNRSLEPVSYTKDEVLDIDPDSFEAVKLNWTQKPREFCNEYEYRFIVKTQRVAEHSPVRYLEYCFNTSLSYAEIM